MAKTRVRETVVFGVLGTNLDAGRGPRRWDKWRPSVGLCQQEDLLVHRFELLHPPGQEELAHTVEQDIQQVSPETQVRPTAVGIRNPWDLEETYGALLDYARAYPFQPEQEDYLVHITTGTHITQISLFLLVESRHIPARLVQTSPPASGRDHGGPGTHTLIDLDLSKYDTLASRFQQEQREGLSFLKAGIDTRNAAFNRLIERIEQVATSSRAPLLLMGPTGAGKSQLARRIYQLKKARRHVSGPFVDVNCATLRGDGAMSALFGHVKGAFTGAVADRPGLLRRRTRACSSSMRSASWARTSRPCSCARSRTSASCRWARTRRWRATSSCSRAPTGTCSPRWSAGASGRICSRASTCGPSGCPPCASGPRTSSPTSSMSWIRPRRRSARA
ncbi:RNA repair transcriptional activator RtcR family protein [Cystobacter fuscus]